MVVFAAFLILLPLSGEAQSITRNKKKPATTNMAPRKQKSTKSKQSSSSSSNGKSKKTSNTTTLQSTNRSSSSSQSGQSSKPIIPAAVQQAIDAMVWVEGGTFSMGATAEQGRDANSDENPVHQVNLSGYYICRYEVTQELWKAVMGNNPSHFTGDTCCPVESVSWYDCQDFISKLNRLTGRHFRLPTEAEWEFAARGGNYSRGYKFAGSNVLDNVAWYDGNSGPHAVGTKSPNELGLYDMSGNVYEWCQDWYGHYNNGSQSNPTGPSSGTGRMFRGGSWSFDARYCRVSNRFFYTPTISSYYLGFRLAASSL